MKWITIQSFEYPQNAYVPRIKLESENIKVFLKDELTIQSDNLLSSAIGGVKLQVPEEDVERAKELLREGGFLKDEKNELDPFWVFIRNKTEHISFLQKLPLELRFLIIVLVLVMCIIIPVVIMQSGLME